MSSNNLRRHTNTDNRRGFNSHLDTLSTCEMIERFDEQTATAEGPGARTGRYAQGGLYTEDGGRCAQAGVFARATTGRAEACTYLLFCAYAEGPSAQASAEAAHIPYTPFAGASAALEASAGKLGVRAGPVVAEINPNLNTSVSVSTTSAEVNVLGFGVAIGNRTAINTPLGNIGFTFW